MKYSNEYQKQVIDYARQNGIKETANRYNLSSNMIEKWLTLNLDEQKLLSHIRQKFYNFIPAEEAKFTSLIIEYLDVNLSENDFSVLVDKINKEIFNTIVSIYKTNLDDETIPKIPKTPTTKKAKTYLPPKRHYYTNYSNASQNEFSF